MNTNRLFINKQREKKFAKIFTSSMYQGTNEPLDDRFNAVGQILTELLVRVARLEDKLNDRNTR